MKTPSIAVALSASLLAGLAVAGKAMPPMPVPAEQARAASVEPDREAVQFARHLRKTLDCHRDVRTHGLSGAEATHLHGGESCEVGIARESTASR